MFKTLVVFSAMLTLGMAAGAGDGQDQAAPAAVPPPLAHFHHVHLNATNPAAAIDFYTTKFDCEKARFGGKIDAVWAQKSWMFFDKAQKSPKAEITSAIWHIGWGAEDMKSAYQKQLDSGTKFETPITDISDIGGGNATGKFFFAYVDGPDHQLIELNTAPHHRFGHIHLLSKDPTAAADWYVKELGMVLRGGSKDARIYRGFQIAPNASLVMDNVNFIIFPMEYAKTQWPELWKDRNDFESTAGHVTDHIGFSVDNLEQTLERLKKDGVKVTDGPHSSPGGKYAFIEGPDRVKIELVETGSNPATDK